MKKTLLLFVSYLFLSSICMPLSAQHFIIGVQDAGYFPLYDFPKNSHTKELLDAFAKSKGYKFTYLSLPLKRINYWYQEEAIDFRYPDNIMWKKGRDFYSKLTFSDPVVELVSGTMVRKGDEGKKREEIKTIGTLLGFHATMWTDLIASGNTKLVEITSVLSIVKQVLHGHLDATNLEQSVVKHYLKVLDKEGELVVDKTLPHEVYTYQLSTIKFEHVILEFNLFLKENKSFVEQLRRKYHITDTTNYL
ncbi:MAG: hypothetical protein ACPG46_01460 [Thalassotalea sp.]